MPFVVVGGTTIPIAANSTPQIRYEEWGDFDRSAARTILFVASAASPRKRVWEGLTTTPLSTTAAGTVRTALLTTSLPASCSGDALGATVSCIPEITGETMVKVAAGHRRQITFSLHEA